MNQIKINKNIIYLCYICIFNWKIKYNIFTYIIVNFIYIYIKFTIISKKKIMNRNGLKDYNIRKL